MKISISTTTSFVVKWSNTCEHIKGIFMNLKNNQNHRDIIINIYTQTRNYQITEEFRRDIYRLDFLENELIHWLCSDNCLWQNISSKAIPQSNFIRVNMEIPHPKNKNNLQFKLQIAYNQADKKVRLEKLK